ncbi:MFS transporter [Amnibacterium sp. CER49]|uniref:MFS transporter n=1 Tax=Amnibacterium sp. CER49 TaxID=3039161 RepID=UPI0024472337|nr:MFS transporter [Amnibacterium sp. CER49]MDH2444902.1 MFS transporter [Amnibacterium sp. CER49]
MSAPTPAAASLRRLHLALAAAFLITGIGMASWVSRTPAMRDGLHASTAEMGLIIFGLSIGAVLGISFGGLLVSRIGARALVALGMGLILGGLVVVAVGAVIALGPLIALGLAIFGYGMGSGEIGQNIEAVALEARAGRSIVPGLHGCYSFGVFLGGAIGLLCNAAQVPVLLHLGVVVALGAGASLWLVRQLPADSGVVAALDASPHSATPGTAAGWMDARVVALMVVILGMALAEGSANDWLPLIVVDGFRGTAAIGSIVYALFGLAMAIGRFSGGRFIDRFGRAPVLRVSILLAAAGILAVVLAPNIVAGALGVLLWGIGTALGFPVAMSAAGDDPRHAARRASAVAAAGYAASLIGPPVLGFLGSAVGIRNALLVVLATALVTVVFAGAARHAPGAKAIRTPTTE